MVIRAKAVFGWRRIFGGISLTWQAKQSISSSSLIGTGNSGGSTRTALQSHGQAVFQRYHSHMADWQSAGGITVVLQRYYSRMANWQTAGGITVVLQRY